ncbi:DUF2025 family protein [Pseudomonas sp. NPDC090755]|uniref:DUF2025 family protein n=1 Tax=Pseudomonas sp. NPDC090755 TaxID=3364481 RepID=UPI00383B3C46
MHITSQDICAAADQLKGFVGFHRKLGKHIVRFSEDAFGMDVADDSITPSSEFVWKASDGEVMTLSRALIEILLAQNVDERLNVSEPLRVYLRRRDLPEIAAHRRLRA